MDAIIVCKVVKNHVIYVLFLVASNALMDGN